MEKQRFQVKDLLVLLFCVMIMATTMGIVLLVLSLFFPVVSVEIGVSRSAFALTGTITALSAMFAALFWGFFYQKHEIRLPLMLGLLGLGLCFLGFSAAQKLYHFYILACAVGLLYGGVSIIPVSTIITRYFTKNTGLALSLAMAGSGLGAMILNPIVNNIINTQSWQAGYRLLAIVVFVVAIPSAFLVTHITKDQIKPRPALQSTSKNDEKSAWSTTWFWALLGAAFLTGLTGAGMLANLPSYMKDIQFSVNKVSLVTSAYSGSMVIGKFILGSLYDRLGCKKTTFIAGLTMVASLLLLILVKLTPFLILMVFFLGIGVSMGTVSLTWLTNSFFGKESYSKYYGSVQFGNSLGTAIGVPLISLMLEGIGNFTLIWLILAALSALMLALFLLSIRGNQYHRSAEILSQIQ